MNAAVKREGGRPERGRDSAVGKGQPWGFSLPLTCLSWNSVRNCTMRSEGMAKEMPAVTLRVLMPMTSPS